MLYITGMEERIEEFSRKGRGKKRKEKGRERGLDIIYYIHIYSLYYNIHPYSSLKNVINVSREKLSMRGGEEAMMHSLSTRGMSAQTQTACILRQIMLIISTLKHRHTRIHT